MQEIYNFERLFHSCPEVDCCDITTYPEVSEDVFYMMEQGFYDDTSVAHLFPFVAVNGLGEPYIDIYIWDVMLYPCTYRRFVICDGLRLSKDVEDAFLNYIYSDLLHVDEKLFESMREAVVKYFPMWKYKDYAVQGRKIAFEHMYYVSHPSGVKEILYKAGLNNIAFQINEVPSYNLIGTTPTSIIGHDLSIKLLRILNQPGFFDKLRTEEGIEHCKAIYNYYSGYIGKKLPSLSQWDYLDRLYENDGLFAGKGFIRALYEKLSSSRSIHILDEYEKFLLFREEYSDIRKLKIPKPDDVWDIVEKLEMVEEFKSENEYADEMIKVRKDSSSYEYCGDDYSVLMPASILDFCKEAIAQGNCVMDYIEDHASGETTILFVRRNNEMDKAYVTVEIKDWTVRQAYARFNELPTKEVYEFLIEYTKRNWLFCDPYHLIMAGRDDCDDEIDADLLELVERYQPTVSASIKDFDDAQYEQLTIEDCFPEILN